jgi:hypothetical protein
MIIQQHQSTAESSGFHGVSNFTIKASAKAFRILSDNIYKNKIAAIIREISTNAVDSHFDAKQTRPFEIYLPDHLDPTFRIRDFGTGLAHDQVMHLYTTYFESTKDKSNDYNGTLGLGSKAPFSYTNTFTVISYFNGMKSYYTAYISDSDTPAILFAGSEETKEPNGLEISFPINKGDISKFRENAQNILYWFGENRPKVMVNPAIDFKEITKPYMGNAQGYEWFIYGRSGRGYGYPHENTYNLTSGFYVCQANILYPMTIADLTEVTMLTALEMEILSKNMVVHVPIGAVNFAPSREALDYTKTTVESLKHIARLIHKEIQERVVLDLQSEPSKWQRTIKFNKTYNVNDRKSNLYLDTLPKKWELYDGKMTLYPDTKMYICSEARVRPLHSFASVDFRDKNKEVIKATEKELNLGLNRLPCNNEVKFYTYTKEIGGITKFEAYRKNNNLINEYKYGTQVFICGDKDSVAKTVESIGNPTVINLDNDIHTVKRTVATAKKWDITSVTSYDRVDRQYTETVFDDISTLSGNYIVVDQFQDYLPLDRSEFSFCVNATKHAKAATLGMYNNVYLIREKDAKKAEENKNLTPFSDYLIKFSQKKHNITIDHIKEAVEQLTTSERERMSMLRSCDLVQLHDADHKEMFRFIKSFPEPSQRYYSVTPSASTYYIQFLNEIEKLVTYKNKNNGTNISFKNTGILTKVTTDKLKNKLVDTINQFFAAYPLISARNSTRLKQEDYDYINALSYYRKNLNQSKSA